MDNFVLFICGITITLISGMGVLVYMVDFGYKQQPRVESPDVTQTLSGKETKST